MLSLQHAHDSLQRQREGLSGDGDDEAGNDSESDGYDNPELGAGARMIHNLDRAVDSRDGRGHDVESDASTRLLGEDLRRRDPGTEDQVQRFFFGEGAHVDPRLGGCRPDRGDVDAGAVVADRNHDLGPDLRRMEPDHGLHRLAGRAALVGELDAMPDRIPDEVEKRRNELLEHPSVDLDVLAGHLPAHVLAGGARHVPDGPVEDGLERSHRHHAGALGDLLELVDHRGQLAILGHRVRVQMQLGAEHVAHPQLRGRGLADQPVQLVDPGHRHLERRRAWPPHLWGGRPRPPCGRGREGKDNLHGRCGSRWRCGRGREGKDRFDSRCGSWPPHLWGGRPRPLRGHGRKGKDNFQCGWGERRSCRGDHDGRRGGGRQKTFQRGLVAGVLLATRRARDETAHAVENQEHRVRELRARSARPGPQLDQQVLEPVRESADAHHADHSGCSFHGVRLAKDPIDRGLIVRRRLECQQPGGDAFEVALGLLASSSSPISNPTGS